MGQLLCRGESMSAKNLCLEEKKKATEGEVSLERASDAL
jgi:hypothetical protein